MCLSGSNHFGSLCGNQKVQNVHLKFLNQNGRQFKLRYVIGPIGTFGVTCMYDVGLWARHQFGASPSPRSYVPGQNVMA